MEPTSEATSICCCAHDWGERRTNISDSRVVFIRLPYNNDANDLGNRGMTGSFLQIAALVFIFHDALKHATEHIIRYLSLEKAAY